MQLAVAAPKKALSPSEQLSRERCLVALLLESRGDTLLLDIFSVARLRTS